MKLVFPASSPITLSIVGDDASFPVRRIYCVGKNYHAHAKEMGGAVSQDAPFFFLKTPQDVVGSGETIAYPAGTDNLHFEVELVVVLDKALTNATLEQARNAIFGYAVGIDLTRRDLQETFKKQSLPWALSKSFTHSAVISPINRVADHKTLGERRITLKKNDEICQEAHLSDMARSPEALLVYLSQLDTLQAGDVLFTGTPAGVGEVKKGDALHGEITGIGSVDISIRS